MINYLKVFWNKFENYIVLILLLSVSLILISYSEHPATRSFRSLIFGIYAFSSGVVADVINIDNLKTELERSRRRNAELMLEMNKLREYAILSEEIRALTGFKDSSGYKLTPARISLKSFSGSEGVFILDRGRNDSIKVGMPVITDKGLVGIISEVSNSNSVIRTIKNSFLRLLVTDEKSRYQGILRWKGSELMVTNLPKTSVIEIGDKIVSSQKSSVLPFSIPVGRVKKILNPEKGIFNDVIIEPLVEIERAEYVLVLHTESPAQFNENMSRDNK